MPSATFERLSAGIRRRRAILANRGDAVHCPACGSSFARFEDDPAAVASAGDGAALCWRCEADGRQRMLALFLQRYPGLLADTTALLALGPERRLDQILAPSRDGRPEYRYLATEEIPPVGPTSSPSARFDAVVCVRMLGAGATGSDAGQGELEALAGLVTADGWCLLIAPADAAQRLSEAGLETQQFDLRSELAGEAERYGLPADEVIWLCEPSDE